MPLHRFTTAADFLDRAEAFLVRYEVKNCLPLGLANRLRLQPGQMTYPPYFASVEVDEQVVAAALMTPPMRLVLAHTESRAALGLIAADVYDFQHVIPGVTGPAPVSLWFAELWQSLTSDTVRHAMAERIYQLARVKPPAGVPGKARPATPADRELLIEWLTAFDLEAFGIRPLDVAERIDGFFAAPLRGLYLWETDQPVSLAGFGGPTPHGIRIGPVYTPPALRGRGYASALVAWLSQDMLDSGRRFCTLFTDLANPTSNHVYQAIGYEPVCDADIFDFTPAVS